MSRRIINREKGPDFAGNDYIRDMRNIIYIIMALVLAAFYSCGKQQAAEDADKNDSFDFSLFYNNRSDGFVYGAHRNVPVGHMVTLNDLDSLFGKPFVCNTVTQTAGDWHLYEQETPLCDFLPTEPGDTLVMMRRIYGKPRDWIVWIDLEVLESDSLRVLNFLAYDNNRVDI